MLLLRLIGLATAVALALMVVLWLVTGKRAWLTRAWLFFRVTLFAVVAILLLFSAQALLAG